MCGIAGVMWNPRSLQFGEDVDQYNGDDVLKVLRHRGPDSEGQLYKSSTFDLWMGHTRLAIQDLSDAGQQPMSSSDGRYSIVFNGEIYNHQSLRKTLDVAPSQFRGASDTETLLYLFIEKGVDGFREIDGIFALAIYDSITEELTLARDGLGVKPLYYVADEPSCVAFSSEIKALEKLGVVKPILDPASIDNYLTYQWCPGEGTPFRGVRKLSPGVAMVIKGAQVQVASTFYTPPVCRKISKRSKGSSRKLVSELDHELREAVHSQMLSDVPVGAFLSGGLDSTSVVTYAREVSPRIDCFTISITDGVGDGLTDDLPYAKRAAKHLNVPLHILEVSSLDLVSNFERMVWALDEPLGDPAPLNVLFISEVAKNSGVKVLLSGAGGDDIFTGYRRHRAIAAHKFLDHLPVSFIAGAKCFARCLPAEGVYVRRIRKLLDGASYRGDERLVNYFRWISKAQLHSLYSDEFQHQLSVSQSTDPLVSFLQRAHPKSSELDKVLGLEQRFFTVDHNLTYTDKMSMAEGVEVRVPLLSKRLVEFASSIPDGLKQKGSEGKWIFKKVMESYLPRDLIYRPKTGFGAPVRGWLKSELKDYVRDTLSESSLERRGIFNRSAVQRLLYDNERGLVDASYTILAMMTLEVWMRQHLDGARFD